jgi:2-polyprenyl-3-methyl-5-hydroxy-6-metoxy-1,4-benzoquinol methylase
MSEYKDYEWTEQRASSSHAYLYEDLKILIQNKNNIILDLGCGNGLMAKGLIDEGFNVYGTDGSISGVELANRQHKGRFYVQDFAKDDLPKELQSIAFNMIISTEVVEHLYDPRKYIKFCRETLLKNGGGEIIISTPYHGYLKNLVMAAAGKMDGHYTALWDGGHIKFWSRQTLTELLNEFGFKVTEFKGSGRLPYIWKSMFLKAEIY